ncbi:MAG: response regulator [Lachnospiraceae bacterium]|nr:response regulator [Lachnospiraceae bacterium]
MLGNMLTDMYEIEYAENGAVALDTIKKEKFKLSLVILDLHMPELDGYTVLEMMHSDPETRRIPVIVLTAEKDAEVKSLQLGAADFITKPYEVPEVIRARVSHSIELAESSIIIHETERDELTGLFHKEFFFEYGKLLDEQNENLLMDAVVIDVNRFHLIKELYGREFGDLVLKTLGKSIHEFVNSNGGLACRSDSNCFYVYIPHQDNLKEVLPEQIERLDRLFKEPKIHLRVGAYSDDGSGLDMEQRFDCARLACGRLSKNYETCYGFYSVELHDAELHSEQLINDMDKALAEKQFKVYFQPKYNIEGEKPYLYSAEALIRWFHPTY